ncbi:MAG: DUF4013 domain-containing protein [Chloroflexi bacterium]|nr:DUF4013 domain-containing protein [Chloroflexota bacterium]
MNIGRAFSYAFEDPEISGKLVIMAALGFVGVITLPLLLVGLVAWAALAGYLVDLIRNLNDRRRYPLPRWENYGERISKGGHVLVALLVYNLPNIALVCLVLTTSNFWNEGVLGSSLSLVTLCCLLPLLLVYNLVTWPMLALGLSRYAEENNVVVFFQFGDLFNAVRRQQNLTVQWVLVMIGVSLVFALVLAIPCIGWLLAPALGLPVIGYLTAQYGYQADQPGR